MNGWVAGLMDEETARQAGKVWGLGSDTPKDPGPWEGEQRNMWKPTQVEQLWFHGGNLHQSRHYSLYLALQLKARYEEIPTPVYGRQEVHHEGIQRPLSQGRSPDRRCPFGDRMAGRHHLRWCSPSALTGRTAPQVVCPSQARAPRSDPAPPQGGPPVKSAPHRRPSSHASAPIRSFERSP